MTQNKKLLVVDDSRVMRSILIRLINQLDPELFVMQAKDAVEAVALSREESFDFFSIDFHMPGDDGLTLISNLRKTQAPASKYALMTANIQESLVQKASEMSVPCIHKPPTEENVAKMLGYFRDE